MSVLSATVLAGCGGGSAGPTAGTPTGSVAATHACGHPGNSHRVDLVVHPAKAMTIKRCVGFSGANISALSVVRDSGVEVQTQSYGSLGLAPCQVAGVPAHYTKCLAAGKPYWALFVSRDGGAWTEPPVGLSHITLNPGDTLGLAYDSPQGTPAPPSGSPPRP